MMQSFAQVRRAAWLFSALAAVSFALGSCGGGSSLASNPPPTDSTPTDTTPPPPPPDTTPPPPPPQDTTPVPADCAVPGGSTAAPDYVGLAVGPDHLDPGGSLVPYTLSLHTATKAHCLIAELNAFRRANVRVFLSLVGNQQYYRDANGFNMAMWKARVDRFRDLDLAPYVADGTILANYVLDEPNDRSNWNGFTVSAEVVDQLAEYSKSIWPTMPTMVRTFPEFFDGFQFRHVDAIRFHYLIRFGPIDEFLAQHVAEANALGLKIVGGLNVLNGGDKDSGIPGKAEGRNAMSPDEIRTWGAKFLQAAPNMCGFLLWEYSARYFERPDIQAAIADLAKLAANYPKQSCAR